jgi:phospholipid N-methyltransferase
MTRSVGVFLRGLVRAPRSVGAIAPSSRHLVAAQLHAARIEHAQVIVEWGPGTGVFTHAIIARMRPEARLFVFEINPVFLAQLRREIADRRVTIMDVSAADTQEVLLQHGVPSADVIVSGLPFTSLPQPVTHAILRAALHVLRPGGVFVTYQYSTLLRHTLRQYFPSLRIAAFVLRNLPPAFVFVGTRASGS